MAPLRFAAEANQMLLRHPLNPMSYMPAGRAWAAACEIFEAGSRHYPKPAFGLNNTSIDAGPVPVGPAASTLLLEGLIGDLDFGTAYTWRARFVTDHVLFPATRWFSAAGSSPLEAKLRTSPSGTSHLRRDPVPRSQP